MTRRYVHSDGADDVLAYFEGPTFDWPRFPHADRLGSTVGIVVTILRVLNYREFERPKPPPEGGDPSGS